jgi:type II secretory pathway component GspD/PulD (secretin)
MTIKKSLNGLMLFFLFGSAMLPLNVIAEPEFKIIDLQHRFAEGILPILQPLAGDDGAVTGMQNHLIIRASPEKMREIEQVISTIDFAHQNLKINVRYQNNQQSESSGASVNGHKRISNVGISAQSYPHRANKGVQIGIKKSQNNSISYSNQFINVMDGETAFIHVGQSIPYTQEWAVLTHKYISVQQSTEFLEITTGFAVRPRVIGNLIELEISPRIANLNLQGVIDFKELSTVIRVNHGEWFNLGEIMWHKDEVSHAILGTSNGEKSENEGLSIKVE